MYLFLVKVPSTAHIFCRLASGSMPYVDYTPSNRYVTDSLSLDKLYDAWTVAQSIVCIVRCSVVHWVQLGLSHCVRLILNSSPATGLTLWDMDAHEPIPSLCRGDVLRSGVKDSRNKQLMTARIPAIVLTYPCNFTARTHWPAAWLPISSCLLIQPVQARHK